MPEIKIFSPDALGKPLGQYSQITRVKASEFVFIAGQVGADRDGKMSAPTISTRSARRSIANIETALKSVGAGWGNVVEFTTYLVHSPGHSEVHDLPQARVSEILSRTAPIRRTRC